MSVSGRLLAAVLAMALAPEVMAAHNCQGRVNTVDVSGIGHVQVAIEGMGVQMRMCNISATDGSVSPESCKAMLSLILSGFAADKPARLHFSNDANTSCAKGNFAVLSTHGFYYLNLEQN